MVLLYFVEIITVLNFIFYIGKNLKYSYGLEFVFIYCIYSIKMHFMNLNLFDPIIGLCYENSAYIFDTFK